jgi:hypothetical protein
MIRWKRRKKIKKRLQKTNKKSLFKKDKNLTLELEKA